MRITLNGLLNVLVQTANRIRLQLLMILLGLIDLLCGIMVRVPDCKTQRSRVRFPTLPNFLSSSSSGTGSYQLRDDK
jgi:hypothetical protein